MNLLPVGLVVITWPVLLSQHWELPELLVGELCWHY